MGSNTLNGSIPASLGSSAMLTWMYVPSTEWAIARTLTKSTHRDLSYNALNGSIPSTFGYLTKLTTLYVPSSSSSSSSIESTAINPKKLSSTNYTNPSQSIRVCRWLHNNQLTGSIPSSVGNLVQLNYLYEATKQPLDHAFCSMLSSPPSST